MQQKCRCHYPWKFLRTFDNPYRRASRTLSAARRPSALNSGAWQAEAQNMTGASRAFCERMPAAEKPRAAAAAEPCASPCAES